MSQATLPSGEYRNSNLFSGYYLDERVYDLDAWDCDDDARTAFETIRDLYESEKDALSSYDEDPLRRHWIDGVLDVLGYEPLSETPILDARGSIDRTLYDTASERRHAAAMKSDGEYAGMYGQSLSILEAKQWDADFTERFSERRSYRDASHQIKFNLEHTPESVSWGILTNGRKWRLYGTKDYETETYYEVDLPELLESGSVEVFKYFYVFFRAAAFRESGGTTFLDTVWAESETAAQELGEDLQDNVFTALRVLGEGFVETNDLAIDPADDERLADLKEQSLVLLYRLMFVLYAESRGLIDPTEPRAATEYEENFSLSQLRREVIAEVGERADDRAFEREFSLYSTAMWGRLANLFSLVDTGNESLGIPPYNGGLFDEGRHEFLAENEVADRYLAEVIYRLSTTETDEGFVPADYADLDTRHLGTIYEGLLEHEFAVAPEARAAVAENGGEVWKSAEEVSVAETVETVEEGELYVVNDDGERKATGAYYTPDYVVTYIVEETVGPLLEDIEAEIEGLEPGTEEYVVEFWERVTDLKILDPAMGSGHFLTKATGYLAEAVMEQVRELATATLFDEEWVRRGISRECIYGVDVNGMAVELAKLSMWLETLAADQPLAFLDHHLKTGNSLVGSDITEVLSNGDDGGQITLTEAFAGTRRRALGHVMDRMGELLAIDNETLDDVHSMEEIYDEIRADPLYGRLRAMATIDTASQFGLDVPADATERMARAIEDEDDWAKIEGTEWYRNAQRHASAFRYFHWELEFPEVFFDMNGERMDSAGFDAVVGNPPYVQTEPTMKNYLKRQFASTQYKIDLFHAFIEQAINRLRKAGEFGYIVPRQWLTLENTALLRKYVLENSLPRTIVDFDNRVFRGATVNTVILLLTKTDEQGEMSILSANNSGDSIVEITERRTGTRDEIVNGTDYRIEIRQSSAGISLIEKINSTSIRFGSVSDVSIGIQAYGQDDHTDEQIENRVFHSDKRKTENHLPLASGTDISRYWIELNNDNYIDYGSHLHRPRESKYFKGERVVLREITDSGRYKIHAAYTDSDFVGYKTTLSIVSVSEYSNQFLTAILNSSLMSWYFVKTSNKIVADSFPRISLDDVEELPLPEINFKDSEYSASSSFGEIQTELISAGANTKLPDRLCERTKYTHDFISELCTQRMAGSENRRNLNLDLLDYLGTYTEGPTLGGLPYQPASGLSSSVLTETEADSEFERLRVTAARTKRDGDRLRVLAVPYVKPAGAEQGEYETLDPVPAMEFFDLSDAQADLIEAFVPHAVAEAGGFAGYRDNATATISPLDRLEGLTLPKLADVEGGIERYMDARERAAELDAKIERTDELIDEIVYELYGLTDEEIEIVEEAVGD